MGDAVIGAERTRRVPRADGRLEVERRIATRVSVRGHETAWEVVVQGVVDGDGRLSAGSVTRDRVTRHLALEGGEVWWLAESGPLLAQVASGEARTVDAWWPSLEAVLQTRLEPSADGVLVDAGVARLVHLLDADGRVRESRSGAVSVRVGDRTPAPARAPDLLALLRLPIAPWPDARQARRADFVVSEGGSEDLHFPPGQVVEHGRIAVRRPLLLEVPRRPSAPDPSVLGFLEAEPGIPVGTPALRAEVATLPGANDAHKRLRALVDRVRSRVQTSLQPGLPDVDATLRSGRGDCNEQAALLVSLARTLGWPARPVTGWVYLDEGVEPGLYPHAWVEIWFADVGWVPVDPVLGQTVADAARVRARTGVAGLERMVIRRDDGR